MKLWHRWAIKMHEEGVPVKEIALQFGKTYATVYWALHPKQQEIKREGVNRRRAIKRFASDPMFKDREWVAWLRQ